MKAIIRKASDHDFKNKEEINSIEDLLKLYLKIILQFADEWDKEDGYEDCEILVTIYDDWVE